MESKSRVGGLRSLRSRTRAGMVGRAVLVMGCLLVQACSGDGLSLSEKTINSKGQDAPDTSAGEPANQRDAATAGQAAPSPQSVQSDALAMLEEGKKTFREDTFGDEAFWGGALRLHEAIAGEALGGVGPGVSPETALAVGLKVDSEAVPAELAAQIQAGEVDLSDPASTLALLKLNAVVGVKGHFDEGGQNLTSVGLQCAFCHSTVDDSFAKGIGKRLDGWPNRDLDVGKIISLSPDLKVVSELLGVSDEALRSVLASWGPGRFDATVFLDGKAVRPDGKTAATLIPAAFGLAGVNLSTYTGWGNVTHWNALVGNLEMHGQGTLYDPRLDDAERFPIAARERFGHVRSDPDLVTPKLAALQFYQLALRAPRAAPGSYDAEGAKRGQALFAGKAQCANCHVPPLYTEPGWNMHTPAEIGIDDFQAQRSPDRHYRTTPLKGLFTRAKGGFYHDGRFATLADVIDHYDSTMKLGLSSAEKTDLSQFLASL